MSWDAKGFIPHSWISSCWRSIEFLREWFCCWWTSRFQLRITRPSIFELQGTNFRKHFNSLESIFRWINYSVCIHFECISFFHLSVACNVSGFSHCNLSFSPVSFEESRVIIRGTRFGDKGESFRGVFHSRILAFPLKASEWRKNDEKSVASCHWKRHLNQLYPASDFFLKAFYFQHPRPRLSADEQKMTLRSALISMRLAWISSVFLGRSGRFPRYSD